MSVFILKLVTMQTQFRGYCSTLTPDVHHRVVEATSLLLTLPLIAKKVGVLPDTLREWLHRAKRDAEKGIVNHYTHLKIEMEEKLAEQAMYMIDAVRERKKNWQATWELLKTLDKESFVSDSLQMQALLEIIQKLKQDIDLLQGSNHGKKMDSESNLEAGSAA